MNDELKKEYTDIIRNYFVIADTVSHPITRDACEKLTDKFFELNIKYFYKFMSLDSKYTFANLSDDIFHFSLLDSLNDPFEYSYKVDIEEEKQKRLELLKHIVFIEQPSEEELEEFVNTDAYKMMESIREYVLVYSLTTTYDNAPMWTTYGNNYNGICVEYDSKIIFEKYNWRLCPIEYTDEIPVMSYDESQDNILRFIHRTCVAKNTRWSNEDEWRIVSIQYADKTKERNDILRPASIIMGDRVSDEDRNKIHDLCLTKGIGLYEIISNRESYKIMRRRIL